MDAATLLQYAAGFQGIKYHYGTGQGGGDDPIFGFDCSGLVSELLRASGVVPGNFRMSAQGIYNFFEKNSSLGKLAPCSLIFFGKSVREITHIAFAKDIESMWEAGGGDSTTTSADVAANKNAFVRLRPIKNRKDQVAVLRPYYPGFL